MRPRFDALGLMFAGSDAGIGAAVEVVKVTEAVPPSVESVVPEIDLNAVKVQFLKAVKADLLLCNSVMPVVDALELLKTYVTGVGVAEVEWQAFATAMQTFGPAVQGAMDSSIQAVVLSFYDDLEDFEPSSTQTLSFTMIDGKLSPCILPSRAGI